MRQYEYSAVLAALKESKFLDITGSEGQELVKRKKAYDPANPMSHADTYTDFEKYPHAYKPENITPNPRVPGGEKAKRKKNKSSGPSSAPKVKQPKPTGFEGWSQLSVDNTSRDANMFSQSSTQILLLLPKRPLTNMRTSITRKHPCSSGRIPN